jgi:4-hydroxybenzoate polyprenyltransferase
MELTSTHLAIAAAIAGWLVIQNAVSIDAYRRKEADKTQKLDKYDKEVYGYAVFSLLVAVLVMAYLGWVLYSGKTKGLNRTWVTVGMLVAGLLFVVQNSLAIAHTMKGHLKQTSLQQTMQWTSLLVSLGLVGIGAAGMYKDPEVRGAAVRARGLFK